MDRGWDGGLRGVFIPRRGNMDLGDRLAGRWSCGYFCPYSHMGYCAENLIFDICKSSMASCHLLAGPKDFNGDKHLGTFTDFIVYFYTTLRFC